MEFEDFLMLALVLSIVGGVSFGILGLGVGFLFGTFMQSIGVALIASVVGVISGIGVAMCIAWFLN